VQFARVPEMFISQEQQVFRACATVPHGEIVDASSGQKRIHDKTADGKE
jgi:hypothetical protein